MTRLRFLLLSLFSSVASAFGMKPNRESMARVWLEKNGFAATSSCDFLPKTDFHRIIWYHRSIPYKAFHIHTDRVDGVLFMRWLDRRDFVIEEKHTDFRLGPSEQQSDNEWNVGFVEFETAPPTLHRFTRPEWL